MWEIVVLSMPETQNQGLELFSNRRLGAGIIPVSTLREHQGAAGTGHAAELRRPQKARPGERVESGVAPKTRLQSVAQPG
jgi:hypothetical protein